MRRVYPPKQHEVLKIYEIAKRFDVITDVWIFGSSVNMSCYQGSDTDILVKVDKSRNEWKQHLKFFSMYLVDICKHDYDLLLYNDLSEEDINKFIGFDRGLKIL